MPGSDGLVFLVILNKSSEFRFELRRSELIFRTWARPVQYGLRCARAPWLGHWVESWRWTHSQYRKIVSLSPRVEKPKLKEGNKNSVPEPRESSVFRVFRIPTRMNILWTFYVSVCFLYSHFEYITIRVYKYTREHNQLIMMTSITNEYTSLYKSLTLYFRKGDVCCAWEMSGDKDGLLYGPKSFLDHSSTSFASWLGLLNRESLRAQSPLSGAGSHFGILSLIESNRLGTWLYYCLHPPASAVLPLIYTGASLDWRLGRGLIYNNKTQNINTWRFWLHEISLK